MTAITPPPDKERLSFREELHLQRWDDHRYYHHSRINQSLHLVSAICFLTCYLLLFFNPGVAAMLGWIVAMCARQIGHFFFEPRAYDEVNHATHDHKEEIKVGYNLRRKRILQGLWAISPFVLWYNPKFFGLFSEGHANFDGYVENLAMLWLLLAIGALFARTVHLFFIRNVQTGLVWATKIITDPFHDFKIYLKSPLYLLKGELIDPMLYIRGSMAGDGEEGAEDAAAPFVQAESTS